MRFEYLIWYFFSDRVGPEIVYSLVISHITLSDIATLTYFKTITQHRKIMAISQSQSWPLPFNNSNYDVILVSSAESNMALIVLCVCRLRCVVVNMFQYSSYMYKIMLAVYQYHVL